MSELKNLKSSVVTSAAYDTLLQILLRIISFGLNALIVRKVSSSVFAVMNVRLYLLYSTGLLLSREAFRRATLSSTKKLEIKMIVNLIWIGSALSLPISVLGSYIWIKLMQTPPHSVTVHYSIGVLLVAVSIFIEVLAEVPFILSELQLWAKEKVLLEGIKHIIRSILLALGILLFPGSAILVYGVTHLCGSVVFVSSYYSLFAFRLRKKDVVKLKGMRIGNFRQLFPSWNKDSWKLPLDFEQVSVCWQFFQQGLLIEILTEGESYVMNFFPMTSLADQGVYQVVNNLASLAARLVFRSIEAAAYKFFAQTIVRGKLLCHLEKTLQVEVYDMLVRLLRSLTLLSLFILVFGFPFSHTLLWLYGGERISDGVGHYLMRGQCIYIVFLALNGVTEAYTFAAMGKTQLNRHNYTLMAFSFMYVVANISLTWALGIFGIIVANCLNMALRIIFSLYFIQSHFEATGLSPLSALLIHKSMATMFAIVFIVNIASEVFIYPSSVICHLCVGGVSFLCVFIFLRDELKSGVEFILLKIDQIACKALPKMFLISEQHASFDSSKNQNEILSDKNSTLGGSKIKSRRRFARFILVDLIHKVLYRGRTLSKVKVS